jgi:hypothetical protein
MDENKKELKERKLEASVAKDRAKVLRVLERIVCGTFEGSGHGSGIDGGSTNSVIDGGSGSDGGEEKQTHGTD